jgi:phage-related protein
MISFQSTLMNGGFGGYKIERYVNGHPAETIYGDTNDPMTMKNCLRINNQGIGFSQNGVDGPYLTLWTIDGSFSANAITAGILKGVTIQGCRIEAGQLSDDAITEITSGAQTSIDKMSQYFYADSTGSHVKTAEGSESVTKADGLHVMHDGTEIARFTANDTHVDNLSVATFAKMGSHRIETASDYEYGASEKTDFTAFYWTGDVK